MTSTLATRFWIFALAGLFGRLLGITFDLAGLSIDPEDVQRDLSFGRG